MNADRAMRPLMGLALFLFPFSVIFAAFGLLPKSWSFASSIVIVLYAFLMLVWMIDQQSPGLAIRNFGWVTGLTFAVEYVGVSTGIPFGSYRYTEVLGPTLLGVPVVIALAWYATETAALGLSVQLLGGRNSRLPVSLVSAILVVALDIVLEVSAAFVHRYWLWEGNRVPWVNYLSWFVLSFLMSWCLQYPRLAEKPRHPYTAGMVYFMIWILFALTDILAGFVLPVGVSLICISGVFFLPRVVRP